jgi:hypothetical protein
MKKNIISFIILSIFTMAMSCKQDDNKKDGEALLLLGALAAATQNSQAASAISFTDEQLKGGLVWDTWYSTDAGGSGTAPTGATNDHIRCKTCHGWDALGAEVAM